MYGETKYVEPCGILDTYGGALYVTLVEKGQFCEATRWAECQMDCGYYYKHQGQHAFTVTDIFGTTVTVLAI